MSFVRRALKAAVCSGALIPLSILLMWWWGSSHGWWSELLLPAPDKVLSSFVSLVRSGELVRHCSSSLIRICKGFSISAFFAVALACLGAASPLMMRQISPILSLLRHIPPMSALPLLIMWLGIGEASKLVIIIMATFFPIFLNTLHGICECDRRLTEVACSFGFSRSQTLRHVIMPAALPSVITGMRLGLGYSWRSLIAAELVAASSGLGYMMIDAGQLSRPDVVIVGVLVIGVLGAAVDASFSILSKDVVA